jgi:hypothetical protein
LLLLALCWFVELVGLPHLLFGEPPGFNWSRLLSRTGVIVAVGVWVYMTTRRLSSRVHELEEFLHMCSWCRKIGHRGTWLSTEDYFGSRFATKTSHGICPECVHLQFPLGSDDLVNAESSEIKGDEGTTAPEEGAAACLFMPRQS